MHKQLYITAAATILSLTVMTGLGTAPALAMRLSHSICSARPGPQPQYVLSARDRVGETKGHEMSAPTPQLSGVRAVVAGYIKAVNLGMRSGNFSPVASIYRSGAILSVSGANGTQTYHGVQQITRFYRRLARANGHAQFSTDRVIVINAGMALSQQRLHQASHRLMVNCTHLYVIKDGKIVVDDFVMTSSLGRSVQRTQHCASGHIQIIGQTRGHESVYRQHHGLGQWVMAGHTRGREPTYQHQPGSSRC